MCLDGGGKLNALWTLRLAPAFVYPALPTFGGGNTGHSTQLIRLSLAPSPCFSRQFFEPQIMLLLPRCSQSMIMIITDHSLPTHMCFYSGFFVSVIRTGLELGRLFELLLSLILSPRALLAGVPVCHNYRRVRYLRLRAKCVHDVGLI